LSLAGWLQKTSAPRADKPQMVTASAAAAPVNTSLETHGRLSRLVSGVSSAPASNGSHNAAAPVTGAQHAEPQPQPLASSPAPAVPVSKPAPAAVPIAGCPNLITTPRDEDDDLVSLAEAGDAEQSELLLERPYETPHFEILNAPPTVVNALSN